MGRRCGSPAIIGKPYCYFHARSRTRHSLRAVDPTPTILHPLRADSVGQLVAPAPPPTLTFDFPPIEDRESIQVSASMILTALGRNLLDPRRAASMLYALQVATAVTRADDDGISEYLVETDPILSDDGADIAAEEPAEEPAEDVAEEAPAPPDPAIQSLQPAIAPNPAPDGDPMTTPILTLTTEDDGDTAIVLCNGKLLYGFTDLLHAPVSQLMATHNHIVLDLAGLNQMDSMGLGVLVRLYVASKTKGCTLELRHISKKVRDLLVLTNLLPVFAVVGESRTWL
jgi:anti-anti-sigma factor